MPEPFELDHGATAYVLVRAMTVVDARTAPLLREVVRRILFVEERRFIAVDLTRSAVFGPLGFGPLIGAVKLLMAAVQEVLGFQSIWSMVTWIAPEPPV